MRIFCWYEGFEVIRVLNQEKIVLETAELGIAQIKTCKVELRKKEVR